MSLLAGLFAWLSGLGLVVGVLVVAWIVVRVAVVYLWLRRRDSLDRIPGVGGD